MRNLPRIFVKKMKFFKTCKTFFLFLSVLLRFTSFSFFFFRDQTFLAFGIVFSLLCSDLILHFLCFVGLFRSGINQWRDSKTPKELLDQFCETHQMAKPQYLGNSQLVMESTIYDLQDFGKLF